MPENFKTLTPGPWRVEPEQLYKGQHIAGRSPSVMAGHVTVAKVYRSEADACLLAAAPDMLAALQALVHLYGPSGDFPRESVRVWYDAQEAIMKAQGMMIPEIAANA